MTPSGGESPMDSRQASLPVEQCFEAARRLIAGENLDALAREYKATQQELIRCRKRWEDLQRKEAEKEARKAATEATREAWVEDQVRSYLTSHGYSVKKRTKPTGSDILATR